VSAVDAPGIASINTLAPGRVWWGIGSGNSTHRFMNLKPLPAKRYVEEIRVIRALLDGVRHTTANLPGGSSTCGTGTPLSSTGSPSTSAISASTRATARTCSTRSVRC
jgi:alkanesulfonate monooxygenase SsuD/methylene tetrahydromethanopterin reductase-like flavin-dependent oxidoreductase (luciferase family)